MKLYLGVDGGGSKTHALIVNEEGLTLGSGRAGNGNYQINREEARSNIAHACREALSVAGAQPEHIQAAFYGLAGYDREADYQVLRPMVASLFDFAKLGISCDTMVAMRAGTSQPFGIVLIGGSGFNAGGVNKLGEEFQFGGFGFTYGDSIGAGGNGLSQLAFRAVIREWDGRGKPTVLTDKILRELNYPSTASMFHDFLDHWRQVPIHLVRLLFDAAAEGDAVACEILAGEGKEMGNAVCAVIQRLGMNEDEFDVVLAGSVLVQGKGSFLTDPLQHMVAAVAPRAAIRKLTVDPVVGAVLSAMELDGLNPGEAVYRNLRNIRF